MGTTAEVLYKKKVLAPKLRFKGFGDTWRLTQLDAIVKKKISYGIVQAGEHIENGMPYIKSQNLNTELNLSELQRTSDEIAKKYQRSEVQPGDIVFSLRGNIGVSRIVPSSIKVANLTQGTARVSVSNEFYNRFIHISLQCRRTVKQILEVSKGSTFQEISLEALRKVKIYAPTLPEQQKIASFLTAVDEKIQLLNHKKELLEQYKKGVMQQLFSGKLRFKDEKGKAFPKWEEKRLKDISEKKSSSIAANTIEENTGQYKIYGASGLLKHIDFYKEDAPFISIVKDGAGVGRTLLCDGKSSVLGTLDIIKPNSGINLYFLYAVINTIHFNKYTIGSTIPHIYYKDYSCEKLKVPCLQEQKKIADFLSSLDVKIESLNTQITQTQTFKKGLLQQMFV